MDGLDFMAIAAWELEESTRISEYQKWISRCEKLLRHSLDGDQEEDGYSLDWAHDEFENETSPDRFVAMVRENKRTKAKRF